MKTKSSNAAVEFCEDALRRRKEYNQEHNIWPSENAIIERLLERQPEMHECYQELYDSFDNKAPALEQFFDRALCVALIWNPEKMARARKARKKLDEINNQIGRAAETLACLFEQQRELNNNSGFFSDMHGSVLDVLEAAGESNDLYNSWIKDRLYELHSRFDCKYWPTLPDFFNELAQNAYAASILPCNKITETATTGSRASKKDFLCAFFGGLEEVKSNIHLQFPENFKISDKSVASLMNCLLELEPDEIVDAAYVKRFRQSERERSAPA